jgi:hypothetical protein
MTMLDQIIQALELTTIDSNEPGATVFPPREVPQVHPETTPAQRTSWPSQSTGNPEAPLSDPATAPKSHGGHPRHHESSPESAIRMESCNCAAMSLGQQWNSAFEFTPEWLSTPAWDENWTEGEINKESCRRLCWSAVSLAAGHSSYTTAYKAYHLNLFITDPAHVSHHCI